ncbi:MAG TPA: DoxX family protein, partial [Polyangia bacterium]
RICRDASKPEEAHMNLGLWVLQILVGAAFVMAGLMKSTRPIGELGRRMEWVHWVSPGTVRLAGVSELAGGIGLIVPWATGIAPVLTPIAAAALVVVMVLAAALHVKKNDAAHVAPSLVLGLLCALIAIGRFGG